MGQGTVTTGCHNGVETWSLAPLGPHDGLELKGNVPFGHVGANGLKYFAKDLIHQPILDSVQG